MSAPAEADEGGGRVAEGRLAGIRPPFTPFAFESVDIVTRRGFSSTLIGFIGQGGQRLAIGGQGALNPFAVAIEENDGSQASDRAARFL